MWNKIACNHVQFCLVNSFTVNTPEHVYFHFIRLIKCCFSARQMNYCTGVPRGTGFFPWGSTPVKRLKTTGSNIGNLSTVYFGEFRNPLWVGSSKSNLRFSVQCGLDAKVIMSFWIIALLWKYVHMHNLSLLVVLLVFIWEWKKITSILFPALKTVIHKTSNCFERGKAGGWANFCVLGKVTWCHEWSHLYAMP